MSGEKNGLSQTRPTGLLGGTSIAANGVKTNKAGDVTGFQTPNFDKQTRGTDGFHLSEFGNGWTTFKDNKTGQGLSSADVVRPLIDQQPMINQQRMPGSSVTSAQSAPINFLGMDGAGIANSIRRSPALAASYSELFGSGVDPAAFRMLGGETEDKRGAGWGAAIGGLPGNNRPSTTAAPTVTEPSPTGEWSPFVSGFGGDTNAQKRAAIAEYQGLNGWLDQSPGTGTYSNFARRAPDRADFDNNRSYLDAQLAFEQKRENRFGNVNQDSWNLQPGSPEWIAYRKSKGLM